MNLNNAIRAAQDLDRLAILNQLELLDTPSEESFDRLTRLASQITSSPISLVSLVDANRQFFKSQVGLSGSLAELRETPLSHSFCMHVLAENVPLVVEDARKHPVLKDNLAVPNLGVIGYLGIPLTTTDGVGLGSFCVIDTSPRKWTIREIEIMHELAFMVMTEIELRAQIKARSQAEEALEQYTNLLEAKVAERTHELRQVYHQLQEIDHLKSKFIHDISHELRTPITNIKLYLDLLARSNQENRTKYETILRKQSDILTNLIEGILSFSSLQKSLDQPALAFIDLNNLVSEVLSSHHRTIQKSGLEFSFTPLEESLKVWGDAFQLKRVVTELLQNALAYTTAGYIHIHTHQSNKKGLVGLTIEDSGTGMDEEEVAHCFRSFYRGKRVGQLNIVIGAGLGLTEVKNIVAFHKGWIKVESEVNKGSIFTVYLPTFSAE